MRTINRYKYGRGMHTDTLHQGAANSGTSPSFGTILVINKLKPSPSPCIICPSLPPLSMDWKLLRCRGENRRSPQTKVQVVLIHRLELWARVSSGLQPRVWNISQLVSQHLTRGLTHIPDMTRGYTWARQVMLFVRCIIAPFLPDTEISLLLWTCATWTCKF